MHRFIRIFPMFAAVALAACGDSTGSNANRVNLSFTTTSAAPTARLTSTANGFHADLTGTVSGHTLVITKAQLVASELQLKGSASSTCATTAESSGSDDCQELELRPVLVDLPVTAGLTSAVITALPAGTYSAMEMKVDAVYAGEDDGAAFLAAHPGWQGMSVRIEGTYDGQPFVFTSNVEAELHMTFATPVTVDANGAGVTINVDVLGWFRDGSGNYVNPATANSGGANQSLVQENIKTSFHAFEDDDHDGIED